MVKKTEKPDAMTAKDAAQMISNSRDVGNFDLARLTAVGWLLTLFSIALPVVILVLILKDQKPDEVPVKPIAIGALAAVGVTFVLGRWGLSKLGIVAVRPLKSDEPVALAPSIRKSQEDEDD